MEILQAMATTQVRSNPSVYQNARPDTLLDFFNGWEDGVLQRAIDDCNCNPYGDPTCCVQNGTFTLQQTTQCYITETFDEQGMDYTHLVYD
jgi:hypothetical protein